MKKVLIITYYWPPSGGAGVQRWVKFVKYLPEFGWEPIVYTPQNPEVPVTDSTLSNDISPDLKVIKTPIWEPYRLYKRFLGMKNEEKVNSAFISERKKPPLKEKISIWIRSNFFIPDARKFWIKPSVRFLRKYLAENPVDLIITTGPPHSLHMIGWHLKAKMNIPWMADFRDPWTGIDYYQYLYLTYFADRKHKLLEKKILINADRVIATGHIRAKDFEHISGREIDVITNGYDDDDFEGLTEAQDKNFSIVHIGAINKARIHPQFWQAIHELINENDAFKKDLKLHLIGKLDYSVNEIINKYQLHQHVLKTEYLPHARVPGILRTAQVLYLPVNIMPEPESFIPGKLFEYLAANRPILGTGPVNGDTASILRETGSGIMHDYADKDGIKSDLLSFYEKFKKGNVGGKENTDILKYSRRNLTKNLSQMMNMTVKSNGIRNNMSN